MQTVTNASANPRVFTDRFGVRQLVPAGQSRNDLDLDQATIDWIKDLQAAGEHISVAGEVSTEKKPLHTPKTGTGALRLQTYGDPAKGVLRQPDDPMTEERKLQEGRGRRQAAAKYPTLSELEHMKRSEVDEWVVKAGLNPDDYSKKEEAVEALEKSGKLSEEEE